MSSQADPSPSVTACAACHEPLAGHYFEINRTIVCEPCRHSIEEQLRGGTGFGRFSRAVLLGGVASLVGMAIYLAFMLFSSYDWSLVSILTGYLVGKAVRKGSGGLGGTFYQMLAVGMTYASLGLTYFAFVLLSTWQPNRAAAPILVGPADLPALLVLAFQMPVIRMKSTPITIAIVGFALWEAWKLNRPGRFVVTGPHPVADGARIGDSTMQ